MKQKCQSCNSCGMPLENQADYALGDINSIYCKYCVNPSGELLPYETILKANADYFKESQGITEQAAIQMTKDLLKTMPAWKNVSH